MTLQERHLPRQRVICGRMPLLQPSSSHQKAGKEAGEEHPIYVRRFLIWRNKFIATQSFLCLNVNPLKLKERVSLKIMICNKFIAVAVDKAHSVRVVEARLEIEMCVGTAMGGIVQRSLCFPGQDVSAAG